MQYIKACGRCEIDAVGVRVRLDDDFCRYYLALLCMEDASVVRAQLAFPKYGAHITVVNSKIHGEMDLTQLQPLHGSTVWFEYSSDILLGGITQTYYAKVECAFAEQVKKALKIVEPPTFLGLHITICSKKAYLKRTSPDLLKPVVK